jgi:hypothetical protein
VRDEETAKATENEITLIVSAKALCLRAFWVQMGPTVFACLLDKLLSEKAQSSVMSSLTDRMFETAFEALLNQNVRERRRLEPSEVTVLHQ